MENWWGTSKYLETICIFSKSRKYLGDTVLMWSFLWPLLCFCGYKVCKQRLGCWQRDELHTKSVDHTATVTTYSSQLCYQTTKHTHMEKRRPTLPPVLRMFPRLQTVWGPTGPVINSPSVSVWMPESQLKNLTKSASGPSQTGTQMNCALGWMAGKRRRAWRLNKKGEITKSPSLCWA